MGHVIDTMLARRSVRTYAGALSDSERDAVKALCRMHTKGPFGSALRFELVELDKPSALGICKMGTYGFIKGTTCYLIGAVEEGRRAFEDYGYCLERIVLDCAARGIGTCWMALTYKKELVQKLLSLKESEVAPAISPVGSIPSRKQLFDRILSFVIKARERKPFEQLFFMGDFSKPLTLEKAGRWGQVLESVRWAPSALNTQPWRIVVDDKERAFHVYCAENGSVNLARMHGGIALCHFEAAAKELALDGRIKTVSAPAREKYVYVSSWYF